MPASTADKAATGYPFLLHVVGGDLPPILAAAADVVVERGRVTKNRHGAVGEKVDAAALAKSLGLRLIVWNAAQKKRKEKS